jgi:hypothetical protein
VTNKSCFVAASDEYEGFEVPEVSGEAINTVDKQKTIDITYHCCLESQQYIYM